MRSLLTRTALIGAFGIALSGCGNGGGSSFSPGGNPNGVGGGNTFVGAVTGVNTTLPNIVIDDGSVSKGAYTGYNVLATDTQSATQYPSSLDASDAGSHSISFQANNNLSEIFKYGTAVPSLTYQAGSGADTSFVNYRTISFYLGYTPGATAPGKTPTVAIELTGGSSTSAYDFRVACTGTLAAAPSLFKCTLPTYGTTTDTDQINGTATGAFTPVGSTTLYLVLVYGAGTNPSSTGNIVSVDSVQATP